MSGVRKRTIRKQKGITLIALVITIIVLLILAGVSIAMLTGQNGILTQASNAKIETEKADVEEGISLSVSEFRLGQETNEIPNDKSFIDWLKDKGYIDNNYTLQPTNILGKDISTGKGETTGKIDVYKLEEVTESAKIASTTKVAAVEVEEEKEYEVVYYDKNGSREVLNRFSLTTAEVLEEANEEMFDITDDGVITLKDYESYYNNNLTWTIETLVIPRTVRGIEVKKIHWDFMGDYSTHYFSSRKNLKTVIIPEGVIEVGGFKYCTGLTRVNLPTTLETIHSFAFENCTSLTNITIPDSVTEIWSCAFRDCTSLTNITIPDSVTDIGSNTFENCTSLTNITIPDSVTAIGEYAFANCTSISDIIIPSSVTTVEDNVFFDWTSSQTIHVPFASEEEKPEGWSDNWNGGNAHIEYAPPSE